MSERVKEEKQVKSSNQIGILFKIENINKLFDLRKKNSELWSENREDKRSCYATEVGMNLRLEIDIACIDIIECLKLDVVYFHLYYSKLRNKDRCT